MTTLEIRNRWNNSPIFTHTQEQNTWKETVLAALLSGADLSGADLRVANLRGADLRGADLRVAYLRGANLSGADLSGASLSGANLSGANLIGADLSDANLSDANLSGADLSDANLRDANLRPIKHDLFGVLLYAQAEVPALLQALKDGKVDGSTHSGDCACLVGTLCRVRGVDPDLSELKIPKNANSLIEHWFLSIKPGDTPDNSTQVKITAEWVEEFLQLTNPVLSNRGKQPNGV